MAKNYIFINSTTLEQREQKITTILITLKNNPSLMAKIVKSNAKNISQEFMDFLILNFYDPLQPKSCSCKSSVHIFEFIKELFLQETKYIDSINDLVDSCPLLFKMIKSLFNQVQLYDFLAVFLKKLLKKNYLKQLVNEQYQTIRQSRTYQRGDTLHQRMFDGDFSQILDWQLSSSKKFFEKFETKNNKDLTQRILKKAKKKKYEELIHNLYKKKRLSINGGVNMSKGSNAQPTQDDSNEFFPQPEQVIYEEMMLSNTSYNQMPNFGRNFESNFTTIYPSQKTSGK